MSTKRPAPKVYPSRQPQVPSEQPPKKRHKPNLSGSKSFKKAHPVNELKSQIRSLTRLLEHKNDRLPATVRVEKERALQSARFQLEGAERAKRRSAVIGKWHKLRFFERRKGEKRLKRLRGELEGCKGEGDGGARGVLEERVRDAEVDVMYALYYPLEVSYVPLFPREKFEGEEGQDGDGDGDGEDKEDGVKGMEERKGDLEMWLRVKQCMADGTLDDLRNGKLVPERDYLGAPMPLSTTMRKERKENPDKNDVAKIVKKSSSDKPTDALLAEQDGGSDDETGGGFFE